MRAILLASYTLLTASEYLSYPVVFTRELFPEAFFAQYSV